jgi:hypothetical protein
MNLEEMLRDNQRTIGDCTGLMRRLQEISLAIAEKQQEQLDRHEDTLRRLEENHQKQLDFHADMLRRLAESQQKQFDRHEDILQHVHGILQELTDSQVSLDQRLDRIAKGQEASDRHLDRVVELLERFLRGQTGNGHPS